jgi:hypothetical protein
MKNKEYKLKPASQIKHPQQAMKTPQWKLDNHK